MSTVEKVKDALPCTCGSYNIKSSQCVRKARVFCDGIHCDASTAWHDTAKQAAAAWNTMQAALQNEWTSEVPTEAGDYMFVGVHHGVKTRKPMYAGVVSYPSCLAVNIDGGSTCIGNMKGHWFRINYPPPPKEAKA